MGAHAAAAASLLEAAPPCGVLAADLQQRFGLSQFTAVLSCNQASNLLLKSRPQPGPLRAPQNMKLRNRWEAASPCRVLAADLQQQFGL